MTTDPSAEALRGYSRVVGAVCSAAMTLACVLLASLVAAVFGGVVLGWMKLPVPLWISQYAQAAFAAAVLLSVGPGLRMRSHLALEILSRVFPRSSGRHIDRLAAAALAAFFLAMLIAGTRLVADNWSATLPQTAWPRSIYYLFVPVGAAVGLLVAAELMVWPNLPERFQAGEHG